MKLSRWDKLASRLATRLRGNIGLEAAVRRGLPPPKHRLILYEYEASPWCRLVREYATILNLSLHIRPCPRQTLFLEGAFDASSRFRPEAMNYLQTHRHTDDLTFPLLVDATAAAAVAAKEDKPIVVTQSYDILEHLWKNYGQNVLPNQHRPDQKWNSSQIPFPLRFLSLAGPSYLRPWPTSGVLQTPSLWDEKSTHKLTLYQAEGCPESRLTREILCTLELPYQSIPVGQNSSNSLPVDGDDTSNALHTPVLIDGDYTLQGAHACIEHLWNNYRDPNGKLPVWWNPKPSPNLGRAGSFGVGAYTAFLTGSRAFVPSQAMQ